jgi:hypothetical protein
MMKKQKKRMNQAKKKKRKNKTKEKTKKERKKKANKQNKQKITPNIYIVQGVGLKDFIFLPKIVCKDFFPFVIDMLCICIPLAMGVFFLIVRLFASNNYMIYNVLLTYLFMHLHNIHVSSLLDISSDINDIVEIFSCLIKNASFGASVRLNPRVHQKKTRKHNKAWHDDECKIKLRHLKRLGRILTLEA